ncbi:MAG: hypothetical protein U0893_28615 [Chloroflexota bacterium]
MSLAERLIVQLKRRIALLPAEVDAWKTDAEQNLDRLGIHRSQFRALKEMMEVLTDRQTALVDALQPGTTPVELADRYRAIRADIVGVNALWNVFRVVIGQRQDARLKPLLDAADFVASDCYVTCRSQAVAWGLIASDALREPPLVFLEAVESPATAHRGLTIEALSTAVEQFRDMQLPVPVIFLPFDHLACIWLFCTLQHEAAHDVDQDLKLSAELRPKIEQELAQPGLKVGSARVWGQWTVEMLADALAVLLGGPGYARSMADMLLARAPLASAVRTTLKHPDDFVRVALLAALLRQVGGQPFAEAADLLDREWGAYVVPDGVAEYASGCATVAKLLLDRPLTALGDRPIRALVPDAGTGADLAAKLADFFRIGVNRPNPKNVARRLIPSAAQLAVLSVSPPDPDRYATIQQRALDFIPQAAGETFLAATPNRIAYLRQLSANLDFSTSILGAGEG